MNKILNDLYDGAEFSSDIKELMILNVIENRMAIEVLAEIAREDRLIQEDKSLLGVTKTEIENSITVITSRDCGKGEVRKTKPSRKVIDGVIAFLDGATLIYPEKGTNKNIRYQLTSRGIIVVIELCRQGYLDSDYIKKNN